MGTSGAYTPSPQWAGVKTEVTRALGDGPVSDDQAHDLVNDFVRQLRDSGEEGFGDLPTNFGKLTAEQAKEKLQNLIGSYPVSRSSSALVRTPGGGGGGSGSGGPARSASTKSGGGGRSGRQARTVAAGGGAVRPAAQRLASFISGIPKVGLRQALLDAGVEGVDKLPADQIVLAIADVMATDAGSIIQTELRDAMLTVLDEVCHEPDSFAAAEDKLTGSSQDLQSVVQKLFECYIVERFKTFFCEHEAAKHGYDAADKIIDNARNYVASEMALEKVERRDLTAVDWTGAEGAAIVEGILERTIAIYTD